MAYIRKGIDRSAPMNRTGAFPLDELSYFESYAAALAAAQTAEAAGSTNTAYYFGQLITVVENGEVKTYKIIPTTVDGNTVGGLQQIDEEVEVSALSVFETATISLDNSEDSSKLSASLKLDSITPAYVNPNEVWVLDANLVQ